MNCFGPAGRGKNERKLPTGPMRARPLRARPVRAQGGPIRAWRRRAKGGPVRAQSIRAQEGCEGPARKDPGKPMKGPAKSPLHDLLRFVTSLHIMTLETQSDRAHEADPCNQEGLSSESLGPLGPPENPPMTPGMA